MKWFRFPQTTTAYKKTVLSPSKISVAVDCPRCFYLAGGGIPQPRGIFSSVPTRVDLLLKKEATQHRSTDRSLPGYFADALPGRKLYERKPSRLSWTCPRLNATLQGIPDDWVVESDGSFSIVDYKSKGSEPVGDPYPSYIRQLSMYSLLAEKIGGFPPLSGKGYLCYVHLGDEAVSGMDFRGTVKEIKIDTKSAYLKFKSAVELLRGDPPPASIECEYCLREARIIDVSAGANRIALSDDFIKAACREKKSKR